ncbi:LysR family transcriptional regulator [Neorhizobium sp. NCHU2750]|uniref:LysR family transcriptional regulator n=1 Tax=Neorhizobium sp. NCHU2750 TaxID=1825976 RepID=UPI000E741D99|nr:LysR family transcriptional regulator [Neorhizobium sp. NCHU2750]
MLYNLRHLRVFLEVVDHHSVTRAAEICNLSQPAVTQGLSKIEGSLGVSLFTRTPQGLFVTPSGNVLARRVRRAFNYLDPALKELGPRLHIVATASQLQALIAVRESQNFTLAARRMGLAQPTVHRAIGQLEQEAARPLFERTAYGIVATRLTQALAQAAQLAFGELSQAEVDLADSLQEEAGRVVVGAMPLSRSFLLPRAIAAFRQVRPTTPVHIVEGPYADLLARLRCGEIDFLIGALRFPAPIGDVEQTELFSDTLAVVAGNHHPLAAQDNISIELLASYPWIVGQKGTPLRGHFDALFETAGHVAASIIESSSLILMRELLSITDHLGCISYLQAQAELSRGLLKALPLDLSHTARPIGLTRRLDWMPTKAQTQFLALVSDACTAAD